MQILASDWARCFFAEIIHKTSNAFVLVKLKINRPCIERTILCWPKEVHIPHFLHCLKRLVNVTDLGLPRQKQKPRKRQIFKWDCDAIPGASRDPAEQVVFCGYEAPPLAQILTQNNCWSTAWSRLKSSIGKRAAENGFCDKRKQQKMEWKATMWGSFSYD